MYFTLFSLYMNDVFSIWWNFVYVILQKTLQRWNEIFATTEDRNYDTSYFLTIIHKNYEELKNFIDSEAVDPSSPAFQEWSIVKRSFFQAQSRYRRSIDSGSWGKISAR